MLLQKILNEFFFWERENEDKRRQKNDQTLKKFPSKTTLFGHRIKKKSTHSLYGTWSFLVIHIQFTPAWGPKTL